MAGNGQRRVAKRQDERVVPSIKQTGSRVSKAAGNQGAPSVQNLRGEPRTQTPRASTRNAAPAPRPSPRGRQSANPGTNQANVGTRRSPSPGSYRPASSATQSPPPPRDSSLIAWTRNQWNSLPPHHQHRVFSGILLILSIILFAAMTFLSKANGFWIGINRFFWTFFGWSSYVLSIGLVIFAVAHLLESIRHEQIIRWTFVGGVTTIWLLLLIESRLIMGSLKVGVLAELLATPLLGWPGPVQHISIFGLLLIVCIFTFRITFGHVMLAYYFLQRITAIDEQKVLGNRLASTASDEEDLADAADVEEDDDPAQYLGQRPQYSRYAAGRPSSIPNRQVAAPDLKLSRQPRRTIDQEEMHGYGDLDDLQDDMHEDSTVEFDPNFDADYADDDPLNDINIHQQQISKVPRGASRPAPEPIDLDEHNKAILNARQQALPLEHPGNDASRIILKSPQYEVDDFTATEMEPLVPNPKLGAPPRSRVPKRSASNTALPNITSPWKLPDLSLLNNPEAVKAQLYGDDTASLAHVIQETLRSFRVDAEVREEDISIGPTVIRFGIRPTGKPEMIKDDKTGKLIPVRDAGGQIIYETRTRVSRIMALQNDLALVLESKTIRMEAPVPGRPYVGVEIPNKNSRLVTLREVLETKEYQAARAKSKLAIGLGRDVAGLVRVGDLARMPHLLIAGATGAGKSVCINTIIASILMQASPDDVRLLMVDPKMVELNMYNGIPHLLSPVVIEVDKVVSLLKNAITEMERRYRLFSQLGVRNLDSYRKMRLEKIGLGDLSLNNLPAIVIIIDELADLMMAAPEEVEGMICRLAQLARATGIHLVVATQRPSVDVITGLIKANIPTRISFMVSSAVDSRTIIDMGGAERLLGRGDMLYLPADAGRPERIQGAFLTDDEAQILADYWRQEVINHAAILGQSQAAIQPVVEPGWELKEEVAEDFELDDDLLDKAEEVVREYGRASISLLQRRLRVGYSRAARLIDLLEQRGIIGHSDSSGRGAREVYENNGGGGYQRGNGGPSVVDEIVEEEKQRNEFLRNQAARQQPPRGQASPARNYADDDTQM